MARIIPMERLRVLVRLSLFGELISGMSYHCETEMFIEPFANSHKYIFSIDFGFHRFVKLGNEF